MLHDILDDDYIQWHPPLTRHYTNFLPLLIWTLLPNFTFYLIMRGFHRTYATGATCQQSTLTHPDTQSYPTLGLAYYVLMSRPMSPELVLSPDFWISNTLGTSLLLILHVSIPFARDIVSTTLFSDSVNGCIKWTKITNQRWRWHLATFQFKTTKVFEVLRFPFK